MGATSSRCPTQPVATNAAHDVQRSRASNRHELPNGCRVRASPQRLPGMGAPAVQPSSTPAVADPPNTTNPTRTRGVPTSPPSRPTTYSAQPRPPAAAASPSGGDSNHERNTTMTIDDRHPVDDAFDDLLTLREVAQILRVPEATLRYWIHKETGPTNLQDRTPHPLPPRRAPALDARTAPRRRPPRRRLTVEVMSDNTDGLLIRFTQSARRHRIGRGSYVMSWQ